MGASNQAGVSVGIIATPRSLPRVLKPGDRIERYELVHPIATGGMGSVWAGRLRGTRGFEKPVAIKTVLPHLETDQRVRAMFLDEARLASAIAHRNVAHILDFLECDGALYLVMEWIEGASLKTIHDLLAERGEKIPIGVLLRVMADVCAGLQAAHELRDASGAPCDLVHRDVSPHNVLVGVDGTAKLIDFGVAKARHRAAHETSFGALKGKLHFMAPEQARGDAVDRRADVWSVGAVMFYVLAGHGPFEMGERSDTLRLLLSGTSTLPLPADVHPAIVRIIEGCLAHRPQDRFQSADELGTAIELAIDEIRIAANSSDVAAFMKECSEANITVDGPSTQGVGDPFALSYTKDDADEGTQSGVRRVKSRAHRTLTWIAMGLMCVAPAATYAVTHTPASTSEENAAAAVTTRAPMLTFSRDEAPSPITIVDAPEPPATTVALPRAAQQPRISPPAPRRKDAGARPHRAPIRHAAATVSDTPSAKRSDDFGSAVETRK